ncbi:hypothetical protein JHD50_09360, partial [Sulfurimonas sp. MAG313]|nr:hypothetical protein [Sulfurimonas sp. MAG313]
IGIFALLANSSDYGEYLSFAGKNLFDWIDFFTASILLPLGGLIMSIFVGYFMPRSQLQAALKTSMSDTLFNVWYFSLRNIVPPALIVVMVNLIGGFPSTYIIPMFGFAYAIMGVIMYINKSKN